MTNDDGFIEPIKVKDSIEVISKSKEEVDYLPQIKLVGKIDLGMSKPMEQPKIVTQPIVPVDDKEYFGKKNKLNQPMRLIVTKGLDCNVSFHVTHLRNVRF